jgi:hypothetical protein
MAVASVPFAGFLATQVRYFLNKTPLQRFIYKRKQLSIT